VDDDDDCYWIYNLMSGLIRLKQMNIKAAYCDSAIYRSKNIQDS